MPCEIPSPTRSSFAEKQEIVQLSFDDPVPFPLGAESSPAWFLMRREKIPHQNHTMWVYHTGRMYTDRQIIFYEYPKTYNASHLAGCWFHAHRRFDEAIKALLKAEQKDSRAYLALSMIQGKR